MRFHSFKKKAEESAPQKNFLISLHHYIEIKKYNIKQSWFWNRSKMFQSFFFPYTAGAYLSENYTKKLKNRLVDLLLDNYLSMKECQIRKINEC